MKDACFEMDPEFWLKQLFSAKAVAQGGVVRRKTRDIDRILGRDRFLFEVKRRGFHAIQNGENTLVFCNAHPITILT